MLRLSNALVPLRELNSRLQARSCVRRFSALNPHDPSVLAARAEFANATRLVEAFRRSGHLSARLDCLSLKAPEYPPPPLCTSPLSHAAGTCRPSTPRTLA